MTAAFRARLRALMDERGVGVRELARRTHYDPGHISKVLNGRERAGRKLAELVDEALVADGALAELVPPTQRASPVVSTLGDVLNDDAERLARSVDQPRRADAQTADYLERVLAASGATAGQMPPALVADVLAPVFEIMIDLRREASLPLRVRLHVLAARYALLIGRMFYEAANLTRAFAWSDQALIAAHMAGDDLLVAYTLARRANLAAATGDARQVIDLASSARERVRMPAPLDAMARRHEAQGHAMLGNTSTCLRRLDEGADLLADATGDGPPYASGFSVGFHQVQAASCLIDLGRTGQAIETLERGADLLSTGHVRAYNLARLAHAFAIEGAPERAAETARDTLTIAQQTGAARAIIELRRIHGDTRRWWD